MYPAVPPYIDAYSTSTLRMQTHPGAVTRSPRRTLLGRMLLFAYALKGYFIGSAFRRASTTAGSLWVRKPFYFPVNDFV